VTGKSVISAIKPLNLLPLDASIVTLKQPFSILYKCFHAASLEPLVK
jgi:hypothetical protein